MRNRSVSSLGRATTAVALGLALASGVSSAHAQSAVDKAAADVLFEQAKKLMAEGKTAEACPKFAESNRLDVGIGTMLYLADCYEKNGQPASAWGQYREAQSFAEKQADSRAAIAKQKAAALEPRLPKFVVHVTSNVDGLVLKRDGEPMSSAVWDVEMPMDPGVHVVEASAPGRKPWQTKVVVDAAPKRVVINVPALENATAPTPTPASGPGKGAGDGQRTIALIVGGIGIVGVGLGAVFGLTAISAKGEAEQHCNGSVCDDTGVTKHDDARSSANISTIAFGVGAAALVGAGVLYFTAPKAGVSASAGLGSHEATFRLQKTF